MKGKLFAALSIGAIAALVAAPVFAQAACGQYDVMAAVLSQEHGETLRFRALSWGGHVVEIWASEAGNWTALTRAATGEACIADTGVTVLGIDPPAPKGTAL